MRGTAKLAAVPPLILALLALFAANARAHVPQGMWLMPSKAVLQIFDCGGLLCGRIVWLERPRNRFGDLIRDVENPDPALRRRALCGQTILWGLRPAGPDRWEGGALYNPDDGRTYRVNAELRTADRFVARIYLGVPLLGENRTLSRVSRLGSDASCESNGSEAANWSGRAADARQ
ncbi:MAG: DUF2147 domain-containing protein [Alphaproteobacteria bacterium]|nr:DUF2147 domain-containing protein [Alphaproteobacteria bacterium]